MPRMNLTSLVLWLGGPCVVLYLINWILTHRRRGVNIKGKVVLISGANSGLGKSCAKTFYRAGCKLILAGRNMQQLKQVASELTHNDKSEDRVKVLQLDLGELEKMGECARQAEALFGSVDILINNAGISYRGQAMDTEVKVDEKLMVINYFGHVALTKALLPAMIEQGYGHIVTVSSIQGRIAIPYRSAYAASKHALQAFFDSLRSEVSDRDIHVSVISPGYIRTNLSVNAVCGDGSKYGSMDQTTASGMLPEEVADLIKEAVEKDIAEVVPAAFHHKIVLAIRVLYPSLYFYIMKKRAKSQRKQFIKSS